MARTRVAVSARRGGGNRGPIFTDYEVNNFLDIMGDVMPIGPLEWALVVDRHKVLFGSKNRDMQSLRRKFNALAGTTPPTGDAGGHPSNCAEGEGCSAGNRDQDGFWGGWNPRPRY